MNLQFNKAKFHLQGSQLLTLDDSLHAEIECVSGSVWITQDGDPRDVMLDAGSRYIIDRTSRVVVFATSAADIAIDTQTVRAVSGLGYRLSLFQRFFSGQLASRTRPYKNTPVACQGCAGQPS